MTPASLSTINGPAVLNGSPFLGDPSAYVAKPAGTYMGAHKIETVSYGNLIQTTTTHSAQLAASEALGGQTDRAIVSLQYEVSDTYAVFTATMGVELRGDVVDYEPAEKP